MNNIYADLFPFNIALFLFEISYLIYSIIKEYEKDVYFTLGVLGILFFSTIPITMVAGLSIGGAN